MKWLRREPQTVQPGHVLAPGYRVVSLLSRGRRLDTYDCHDEDRDARVVVKMLRPDRRDEERVLEAVRLEGHLATTLQHPNLVRGFDVIEDPGPGIVFQMLTGATLGALIDESMEEGRPLGVRDVCQLGLQLVSALGYVHRQGWLHLDVKPNNIVVQGGQAILIDFSLAGRPGAGREGAGTRGYIAPEQARGQGLSSATDVWGLGITVLECLAGDLPYGDEATWDAARRIPILHRRMPTVPELMPEDLPRDLAAVLRRTIELEAAARPSLPELREVFALHAGA
ncbi:MAG: serine/threonine-protein kinase [Brachybacterium sp.]|nr:serine/threonine-protein kinase [Brachybacterium sp.]